MNYIFSKILAYLFVYKYFTLFTAIFLSAVIVPFPANTVLLAIGAFSSQHYFSYTTSFIVALIANILGDCVGFALAEIYGRSAIKKFNLNRISYFSRLEKYIKRRARLSIFVTRFITSLSSIVNILVGLAGVPFGIFILYDIIGNFLNIGFFLSLGFLLGNAWQAYSAVFTIIGSIAFIVIVVYILLKMLVNKDTLA